uniref:DUF3511 domain-containing protein n=1 Tax=Opuntia streptacantha TaxID=393608 RepID=A0A7C9E4F0_OPUST
MENFNFRSMSCREGRMQNENENQNHTQNPPSNMKDLRSFSTSYASNYMQVHPQPSTKDSKPSTHNKNSKKNRGSGSSSNANSSKGWSISDPEIQRKKRVASYKVYAVEGKMKGSLRKSFRWIRHTCSQVVHGWW